MSSSNISMGIAFIAGLASFLSPCVFSLVPAYIGYLGGRSAASSSGEQINRWLTLSHGLAFVLGFSVIFTLLGVASSALGGVLYNISGLLSKVGGVVVIIFGIHMTGLIRIPLLEYDLRPQSPSERNYGYLSSFLMGIFFSAGWSPCVGPILGSILTLALNSGSVGLGVKLLSSYSAGLAIPFLFAAVEIGLVTQFIRRYGKVMHYVEIVMGVVLIIVGILLFLGRFETIASLGSFYGIINEIAVGRMLLIGFLVLLLLGLLPAFIATKKGRSFIDWWIFGTGLFVVAFPIALLMKSKAEPGTGKGGNVNPVEN